MNYRQLKMECGTRPWMAMGLSLVMLSSIGCCGTRGQRLIQIRNSCSCNCTSPVTSALKPVTGCATTPSVVATAKPQPQKSVNPDYFAKPAPESSSRRVQAVNVTPKTDEHVAVEGKNDKLHSVVDPEMIRQLAMTPTAPEPPKAVEIPATNELAGTQLLAKPAIDRDSDQKVIAAVERVQNQAEEILNSLNKLNQAWNEKPAEVPTPAVVVVPVVESPKMVVLRAVAPDSIMRSADGNMNFNHQEQVASPIGSGVPALQASQLITERVNENLTPMARPLAPGSFPPPTSKDLIFRQAEPVILKAGSVNADGSANQNPGVTGPINAASINGQGK